MNLFCRLLGHTWVPRSDNPKIRWTAAENMSEMQMQSQGEVHLWEACARCGLRRDIEPRPVREGTGREPLSPTAGPGSS